MNKSPDVVISMKENVYGTVKAPSSDFKMDSLEDIYYGNSVRKAVSFDVALSRHKRFVVDILKRLD